MGEVEQVIKTNVVKDNKGGLAVHSVSMETGVRYNRRLNILKIHVSMFRRIDFGFLNRNPQYNHFTKRNRSR